ncbi:AMP-binding protein [Saccharicrinis sp. FJH54]|uniref:AMP-binding protein n=1 Tax=Saccharicrinis sp. FJH54 TaxID=3344665 RepID=UPI0035D45345
MGHTETFITLIENAIKKYWNSPAFSDYEGQTLTYSEVGTKILKLHKVFEKCGLKKNDKISLVGRNQANWGVVYLAAVSYGAVIVPILPDFKTSDIHHIVTHSDSLILFISDNIFEKIDETKMPHLKGIVSLSDFHIVHENEKCTVRKALETLDEIQVDATRESFKLPEASLDDIAVISYTSGTSGFSKGVVLPNRSLWNNARIVFDDEINLHEGDRIVSFLPLAHAYGCLFEFLTPFIYGCHITFLTRTPSPQVVTKAFREIKPNMILAVPLIIEKIYKKNILPAIDKSTMKLIMKVPLVNKSIFKKINDKLTSVFGGEFNDVVIGGAAFNKDVEKFLKRIGFKFSVGYGMTECGPLISYRNWQNHKPEAAGRVVPGMEVKVDSEDPRRIPGEILVRGKNVMVGYYKNPQATKEVFTDDGWLKTGDLGVIDEENFIYIKGRSKNMILGPSGQNIYPEEIEAVINNMPYVMESLVKDSNGKLEALVYPDFEATDAAGMTIQEVEDAIQGHRKLLNEILPGYMNISKITLFPSEFEKTPKKSIKRYLYTK